jgi:hypothetical protein
LAEGGAATGVTAEVARGAASAFGVSTPSASPASRRSSDHVGEGGISAHARHFETREAASARKSKLRQNAR